MFLFVETADSYGGVAYEARNAGRTPYPRGDTGYMTPGYDPNKGVDDFRREHDPDEVDIARLNPLMHKVAKMQRRIMGFGTILE